MSSSAVLKACTSPLVLRGSSTVPSMRPSSVPLVAQWRTSTMRAMALRPSVAKGRSGDCVGKKIGCLLQQHGVCNNLFVATGALAQATTGSYQYSRPSSASINVLG